MHSLHVVGIKAEEIIAFRIGLASGGIAPGWANKKK